ncbi:MAG: PIG-L family deacetylase [Firmicutes bacterium]|jgi:LmbE family N-acetylglucosaminyl deacetylase|nr:PIG-L family deacetylase [Bacillota bacterium]
MAESKVHIMAVGAHCADVEVASGLLIAKYTMAGHKATIVHLSPGEKGHRTLPPEEYAKQKIEEAHKAAEILKADVRFLPYKDAEIPVNDEAKLMLADIIREVKPNVIVTHWKGSIHKDHTACHHIVEDARFYAALPAIKRELPAHGVWSVFYSENWEDMHEFEVDTYVDVTDAFDVWVEACNQYELLRGGISSFRYMDYYKALATMRGCLAGYKYAVGLMRPKGAHVTRLPHLPGFPL